MTIAKAKDSIEQFFNKLGKDDIVANAAALAFYTVFALAPLVILLLTLLASLKLSLQQPLIAQVQQLMGSEASSVLESIIINSEKNAGHGASIWGFIALGISASVIFAQLQSSLNIIFDSEKPIEQTTTWMQYFKIFITRRLICFGMVLTFIFISIVSLVISGLLTLFAEGDFETWMKVVQTIGNLLVYSLLFAVILKWMPDRKVGWKASLKGGFITALLFVVGKILIGLYIGHTAIGSAYGAAGSLIVLLVWVYYSSLIILLGAEISAALSLKRG